MQLAYEKQSRPLRHLFWDTEDLWTVNVVDAYRLLELSWSKWLIMCLPLKKQGMTVLIHGFPAFGYDSLINNPIKMLKPSFKILAAWSAVIALVGTLNVNRWCISTGFIILSRRFNEVLSIYSPSSRWNSHSTLSLILVKLSSVIFVSLNMGP